MDDKELFKVKGWAVRNRLEAPILFFLYSLIPFSNLTYHGALASLPLLQFLFGERNSERVLALLRDREKIKRLISLIEEGG